MTALAELDAAADLVHRHMPPTPQYLWPLLCERAGCEVWVKHENHTPIGAFKLRGGLVYLDDLVRRQPDLPGVIAATRGNHGQSVAYAAKARGLSAVVVVPQGNSKEKNRAMRALGAELVEQGRDFDDALEHAARLVEARGLHFFPSFHPLLARGAATYGLELLRAVPELDVLYVPIGLGSGICGAIAARDALGRATRIVGVVAEKAATYALSFEAGEPVPTSAAETLADGLAVRNPHPDALDIIRRGVERVVTVTESEITAAMRALFTDTHNVAEGAGAAALAALLKDRTAAASRVGVILSGGNIDGALYRTVLGGQ